MNTDASWLSLLSAGPLSFLLKEQKKGSQKLWQLRQWKASLEKDAYPSSNIPLSCS